MKLKCAVFLAAALAFAGTGFAGEPVEKADMIAPVLVGMQAPHVSLKTPDGGDLALKDAVDGKPTVLVFYRGSW